MDMVYLYGHDQQMLDGAVLALADDGRAHQHDGQDGDVGGDLHHRGEPRRIVVGVEVQAALHPQRQQRLRAGAGAAAASRFAAKAATALQ